MSTTAAIAELPNLKHFWLLDNNVYRTLVSSDRGEAIFRFNDALDRVPILKNTEITALTLTPFGVLEAIGVVPPKPPSLQIPVSIAKLGASAVASYLMGEFDNYLSSCDALTPHRLLASADAQKRFTSYEAKTLFDASVMHPLSTLGFDGTIKTCLAFDYLFKFQFSRTLAAQMHMFFLALFFQTEGLQGHVGKFRFARRLWEQLYSDLLRMNPGKKDVLELYNRSMSIKNAQDYLDCDIVHFLCFGYDAGDCHFPVVVFTQDDLHTTMNRISVFKGIMASAKTMIDPAALASFNRDTISHAGGILVPCSKDGGFQDYVRVSDIPGFM